MTDINELRRLTQAALAGPDGTSLNWIKLLQDFQQKVSPAAVSELLDRLEAAETEALEEARLNGIGAERELALMAKLEAAEKEIAELRSSMKFRTSLIGRTEAENTALRAKIAEMEKQEPVATIRLNRITGNPSVDFIPGHRYLHHSSSLYALPGAQSVPDTYAAGINAVAAMLQSKADEYAKEHGHDDMGGLSFGPGMGGEIKMDYYTNLIELVDDVRAMLADAPSQEKDNGSI